METKAINKAAKACISYIQSGKAKKDNWLNTKKDILNKWNVGFILTDKQAEIITNMYNMEVMKNTVIEDLFSGKVTRPKKPKPLSFIQESNSTVSSKWVEDPEDELPF